MVAVFQNVHEIHMGSADPSCLSLMVSYVSWMQNKYESCFLIWLGSLCLSMGELRSLVLRSIDEQCLLLPLFRCYYSVGSPHL